MKKKIMKSILALTMVAAFIFGVTNTSVYASNEKEYDDTATVCDMELGENTDNSGECFRFITNPNSRMESDGSFTFSYSWKMQSDYFKPANSSIKVYATATSSTSNKTYYISLYKYNSSGDDKLVDKIKYTADGTSQYYQFTGLSTSSEYYLYFTLPLTSSAQITGTGKVVSIK